MFIAYIALLAKFIIMKAALRESMAAAAAVSALLSLSLSLSHPQCSYYLYNLARPDRNGIPINNLSADDVTYIYLNLHRSIAVFCDVAVWFLLYLGWIYSETLWWIGFANFHIFGWTPYYCHIYSVFLTSEIRTTSILRTTDNADGPE